MLEITDRLRLPEEELAWSYARSGGPGGQNVNKVASKAVLHWDASHNQSVPAEVKARLRLLYRRRFTADGVLVLSSQRFRDQEKNRADCLEKLSAMLRQAATPPKPRQATRPTRGSREARLRNKRLRAVKKSQRRHTPED